MAKTSDKSAAEDLFGKIMTEAAAGYELYCRQACRGLKVYMAVNVFGIGTILPNDLSDYDRRDPLATDDQFVESEVMPSELTPAFTVRRHAIERDGTHP